LTETDEDVMLLTPFVDVEDEEDFNVDSDVLLTAITMFFRQLEEFDFPLMIDVSGYFSFLINYRRRL